jgi:uncharacterized protein (TIGR03083 family)
VLDRIGALREERAALLGLCRDLDDAEWQTPSAAKGWRVQDVVAHMGSGFHGVFTPAALTMMRSKDIERTNDVLVDERRGWPPAQTLAEYERWSNRVIGVAAAVSHTPLAAVRLRLGELGRFPFRLLFGSAFVFDHHTHLRHDIVTALGRPMPGTDANRMAVVLEWMFAVLSNQLRADRPAWLTQQVAITLDGPGGGSWLVHPDGRVTPGAVDAAVAQIAGAALAFPVWGTRRADWRACGVRVSGDSEYGSRFLDELHVV